MPSKRKMQDLNDHYLCVSGPTIDSFTFIGQRFLAEPGYKPHESESWVLNAVRKREGFQISTRMATMGWLTGLWRSPSGKVFVSEATNAQVYLFPDIDVRNQDFSTHELEGTLTGVWGLDDSFVLTWGSTYEGDHLIHRWNGKGWVKFPSPPFSVRAVHGTAPDFLYAVGKDGGVARFDGRSWRQFPTPTSEVLNGVFVAGPDEYYATGARGTLLEGSTAGWGKIGEAPVPGKPLLGVAKWKKTVWVAGGTLGLFRRPEKGKALEQVKASILANGFDVRKDLLISTANCVATSTDGKDFIGTLFHELLDLRKGKKLGDFS